MSKHGALFNHPYHYHYSLNSMMSCLDYRNSCSLVYLILPLLVQPTAARGILLKNISDRVTPPVKSFWWLIQMSSHGLEAPAWCGPHSLIYLLPRPHFCHLLQSSLTDFFCHSLNKPNILPISIFELAGSIGWGAVSPGTLSSAPMAMYQRVFPTILFFFLF